MEQDTEKTYLKSFLDKSLAVTEKIATALSLLGETLHAMNKKLDTIDQRLIVLEVRTRNL